MEKIIILVSMVLLSGCSGLTFNEYENYTTALSAHSTAEATRISAQSDAISNTATGTVTETKMESVLLSVIAMNNIATLKPIPLDLDKPTTGMDVLKEGVGYIPFVANSVSLYKLGEAGIKAAGNVTIGDDAVIDDSFNQTETHATGDSNTADSTLSPDTDNSTETAVAE